MARVTSGIASSSRRSFTARESSVWGTGSKMLASSESGFC